MQGLLLAPRRWTDDHPVVRALRSLRMYELVADIYHRAVGLLLWLRHPKAMGADRTGTITVHGTRFRMYDPDLLYLPDAMRGTVYEPAVTHHLASVLEPGMTFLDIGAEFGFYTCYAGALDRGLTIHAFEPNGSFYLTLTRNLERNAPGALAHRFALSDAAGSIRFSDRSMSGEGPAKKEVVEAVVFDDWAARNGVTPDVVKIDVHGGEGKVVHGMKRSLREHVRHVYCELHPTALLVDYTVRDVLDALRGAGFTLFEVDTFRQTLPATLSEITQERYEQLVDESFWTDEQVADRRMIYGRK